MNKSSAIDKSIVLILLFSCPLIISFEILDSSFLPRFIILSFFLSTSIIWLLYNQWKNNYAIPWKHPITLFMLFWVLSSVVSGNNVINRSEYLAEIQKIVLYFTTFLVFATLLNRQQELFQEHFLKASLLITLVLTTIGAYQVYKFKPIFNVGGMMSVTSLMNNKNLFSEYIALYFPFLLIAILNTNRIWKAGAIISVISILFFIVILLTRSVWVAIPASFLFVFILTVVWHSLKKQHNKTNFIKWAVVFIALIVVVSASILIIDNASDNVIKQQLISITETDKGSAAGRLQIWKKTFEMTQPFSLVGLGAGNWKLAFQSWGLYQNGTTYITQPLNDYIGIWSECGLIGFIAYIGILLTAIILMIKTIFSHRDKLALFYLAALSSLIIYCIISGFSFPKDRVEHSVFLCFLLAFSCKGFAQKNKIKQIITTPFLLILFAGLICCGWYGCQRYVAEKHTRLALEARNKQQWKTVITQINKAENPYYTLDPTTTPVVWYRGLAYFELGKTDLAFIDFQAAYKANPYHTHVLNNLATCFELKGNHEQAITLYKEAIRINPYFDDALLNVSSVLFNLKQYEEALTMLENSPAKYDKLILERRLFLRKVIEQINKDNHNL